MGKRRSGALEELLHPLLVEAVEPDGLLDPGRDRESVPHVSCGEIDEVISAIEIDGAADLTRHKITRRHRGFGRAVIWTGIRIRDVTRSAGVIT